MAIQYFVIGFMYIIGGTNGQYHPSNLSPFEGNACPAAWTDLKTSKCLLFVTDKVVTFEEAGKDCAEQGANLLTIDSKDDLDGISKDLDSYPTDGFWTSLVRIGPNWYWKDQFAPDMSLVHWNQEPDNANGKENCGAINTQVTFSDEDCSLKLGFICEMAKKEDPDNPCSMNWILGTSMCYYISSPDDSTELLTWQDAKEKCKYMDTAPQLVAVRDDENTFLSLTLPEQADGTFKWWTSLNRQDNTLLWDLQRADSQQIKWTKEPNNLGGGENCGVMYENERFADADCTKEKNYICQKNDNTVPISNDTSIFGCDNLSWLRAGHKCYYFQYLYKTTWAEGRTSCTGIGADYIKIQTPDEMAWVSTILDTVKWQSYWSGLNDQTTEGTWVWADGTTADTNLVQWNQEPNDMAGREDCAMIMPDGVFNDGRCNYRVGYICQAFVEGTPCPATWIDQDMACYWFQPANSPNNSLTWYEARDRCRDLALPANGFLLAIGSQTEREFVTQQVMGFGPDATAFWTGLNDRFNEGLWTYDTDFNNPPDLSLIQWNSEPNGGPDSNCGVIMSGGRYDDQNCNTKHNFICEKPVQASKYLRYNPGLGASGYRFVPSVLRTLLAGILILLYTIRK